MAEHKGAPRRTKNDQARSSGFLGLAAIGVMISALVLSVISFVAPASATTTTCDKLGYTKIDQESGTADLPFGSIAWGGAGGSTETTIVYDIKAGYTVTFCLKASTEVHESDPIAGPAEGSFDTGEKYQISHVGYKSNYEEPPAQCPDGTNPGDLNEDGEANEEDCGYEPPPTCEIDPTMPGCEETPPPTCETDPTLPGCTPPVVTPPVVVPPVVTPPVVTPTPTPEPEKEPKKVKPTASVNAVCVTQHFGEGVARLNNKKSEKKVTFRIVRSGPDKFVTVKADKKKRVPLTGLKVGSVLKVKALGKVLAKTKVPGGCEPTPVPDTGFRMAVPGT